LVSAGGGIQGRFSSFIDPFTSNTVLQPGLVYEPDNVILELLFTSFVPFAFTQNQLAVARNLDNVVFDSRAAALIDFLTREPVSSLPADFDRIAPADLTSVYEVSFSGANIQRLNLTNRMEEIRDGATGFSSQLSVKGQPLPMGKDGKGIVEDKSVLQPAPENRWGVFVSGDGDFVNVAGDGNASGYDFTTAGVTLGVDYRVTDNLAIGLMGGYARTWTDLVRNGRVYVNTGKGGFYATWWNSGFYVNGFLGGGYNGYETRRGALQGLARGNTDGGEFEIFSDAGYDAKVGNWSFGPYATLAYTYVSLNSFTENGSLAPLDIVYQHQDSLRTDLGIRAEYRIKTGGVELRPHVRAAWEHEYFYSALPIDARLASGAGGVFTVFGPSEGHDSLIISAGISAKLTEKLLLYLDYDGQVARDHYASQAVVGGLRWSF
jgi:outer membrane autotransporter protein